MNCCTCHIRNLRYIREIKDIIDKKDIKETKETKEMKKKKGVAPYDMCNNSSYIKLIQLIKRKHVLGDLFQPIL